MSFKTIALASFLAFGLAGSALAQSGGMAKDPSGGPTAGGAVEEATSGKSDGMQKGDSMKKDGMKKGGVEKENAGSGPSAGGTTGSESAPTGR